MKGLPRRPRRLLNSQTNAVAENALPYGKINATTVPEVPVGAFKYAGVTRFYASLPP
jgi:hypothetical protein